MAEYRFMIRHKPTGLYFKPTPGAGSVSSNFTRAGKVYTKRPSFNQLPNIVRCPRFETLEQYRFFADSPEDVNTIERTAEERHMADLQEQLELVRFRLVEDGVERDGSEEVNRHEERRNLRRRT